MESDDKTKCTKCMVGYYKKSDTECKKCLSGCAACTKDACTTCMTATPHKTGDDAGKESGECIKKADNCDVMKAASKKCTTCKAKYYEDSGSCTKCTYAECATCDKKDACKTCMSDSKNV